MPALDITQRLQLLARGDNFDLADLVCNDAIAEIKRLRRDKKRKPKSIIYLEVTPNDVATMEQFMKRNGYTRWERLNGTVIGRAFRLFR